MQQHSYLLVDNTLLTCLHSAAMTTGLDLKVRRTAARVKATDLAAQMGVSKSRISAIEREQFPSLEARERYLRALATLSDVPHVEASA